MYSLVQRSEDDMVDNVDATRNTSEWVISDYKDDKIVSQDDFELFRIDITGQKSNEDASKGTSSDDDDDDDDDDRKAIENLFKVDTLGGDGNKEVFGIEHDSDDDDDITVLPLPKFPVVIKRQEESKSSSFKKDGEDYNLNDTYLDIQLADRRKTAVNKEARKFSKISEVLKKSVIKPGFEKLESVPAYQESDRILQKKRKKERDRTKGSDWFNMPATELTDELKSDLEVLQMRSILDPKHFYKKNDLKVLPKYFQVGKVIDSPADFYHSRIPKKERKQTIVEELLADSEFKRYNKRRYKEIIEERRKTHFKAHAHAKKLKRKK